MCLYYLMPRIQLGLRKCMIVMLGIHRNMGSLRTLPLPQGGVLLWMLTHHFLSRTQAVTE